MWYLPTGAYLLASHRPSELWYVDISGRIHKMVNGDRDNTVPLGDGGWFYNLSVDMLSEPRSVSTDQVGNILIVENDAGYVRKIEFLPWDE